MNSSKYKISNEIRWADNLGRWVVAYQSDVYPIKAEYILPDSCVHVWSETKLADDAAELLGLNFWFACFQYEQSLKNNSGVPNPAPSTPVNAVPPAVVEGPTNAQ